MIPVHACEDLMKSNVKAAEECTECGETVPLLLDTGQDK